MITSGQARIPPPSYDHDAYIHFQFKDLYMRAVIEICHLDLVQKVHKIDYTSGTTTSFSVKESFFAKDWQSTRPSL